MKMEQTECSEGVEHLLVYEDETECSEGVENLPAYGDGTDSVPRV